MADLQGIEWGGPGYSLPWRASWRGPVGQEILLIRKIRNLGYAFASASVILLARAVRFATAFAVPKEGERAARKR
jgi:hypothetical protein